MPARRHAAGTEYRSQHRGAFQRGAESAGEQHQLQPGGGGVLQDGGGQTGNQDLVFQNGANLVPYVNSGDGIRFAPQTALTGPSPAANYAISTVLLTDVNGDGNGDIVALYHNLLASDLSNPSASTANWLYIWFGNGDGTFTTPPQKVSLSRNFYLAAVADMNGDTLPDIVLSDGYVVCILYNQSGGIFQSDFNTCKGGLDCAEAHFLAGQGINSLTLESVSGSTVPDLVVANGGATISNAVALEGTSASPISLTPNPADVNTGGITVLLNNITAPPPTGTLKANPEPSTVGEAFTITATLTPTPGVAAPTGFVAFSLDGIAVSGCSSIPVVTVANTSTAQCPVPIGNPYAVGTYLMTAFYGGDPNNAVATLNGTHNIQGIVTNTVLALCIGGSSLNCPVTGAPIGTLPVVTPLSMTYGQVYNGTETVTDQDGSAFAGTGSIDFYQDNVLLCTLQALGTIPCPPNVGTGTPAGTHVYVSVYSGDSTYTGSTSPAVTIIVGRDTPTVTVSSSQNPAPSGQAVMLTAKLIGTYAPLGTPASPVGQYLPATGTVVFMNGSTTLCSSPLAADSSDIFSTATCTTSTLPVGTDQITASYAAGQDINFFGATSTAFSETITPLIAPSFAVSATPNPTSVGVGYAAIMTVTVIPLNGFAEDVNLACGSLPTEATCTFAPAAIASGGGASQLFVLTAAPHSCGTTEPYFLGGNGGGPHLAPFALPALAGLVAFLIPGKRRWLRALMALIAVAAIAQMTGCGNCTDLGTRPATYTFQVIGTSAGTGEVQSQTVTLNITI